MNFGSSPVPFNPLPWSKEWAAYLQADILWKVQDWKTRCNSPMPIIDYGKEVLVVPVPIPPEKHDKPV